MSDVIDNAEAVVNVATRAARPTPIGDQDDPYALAFSVPDGGRVETIDVEQIIAPYRPTPRRKSGTYKVTDAESFCSYMDKHGEVHSEVWADVLQSRVTGIINAHAMADPGWADHRVVYDVAFTDAWKAWIQYNGKLIGQTEFAELIEERSVDVVNPSAADMLELAQTFHATIGAKFESSSLLSSGERQFEYREQIDAQAGKAGRLDIPTTFELALIPFEGAAAYSVKARFRYRINNGQLLVGYSLERPGDVLREAFLGVVEQINEATSAPVYRGVSA